MADAAAVSVSIAYDSPAHRVLIGWGVRGQLAAELERMASATEVEDGLAKLRAELSAGPDSPAIEPPKA